MAGIAYLTRREHFSASHRLHSQMLNDEENKTLYGKCNNPNGHGHNYNVEIVLRGEINPKTGMIMNICDLKRVVKVAVLDQLDHKNIDLDIEYFKEIVSTAENIAVFIWKQMKKTMIHPELLYEVKLYETERNIVSYKGE